MGWDDTEVEDGWLPVPLDSTQNVDEYINADVAAIAVTSHRAGLWIAESNPGGLGQRFSCFHFG